MGIVLALGLMERYSTSSLPGSEAHSGGFLGSGIEFRDEMFKPRKSPVLWMMMLLLSVCWDRVVFPKASKGSEENISM